MHHPQVFQSPIYNDCLKVNIDDPTGPKIVSELLLRVSVRELHNILVRDPLYGGLKEIRDTENNIIISYSKLRSLLISYFKIYINMQVHVCF